MMVRTVAMYPASSSEVEVDMAGGGRAPCDARISIVIPCHNEAQGLQRLLPSACVKANEVIVVDNGSTDQSAAVARSFGAIVLTEPQRGMGHAHRRGLSVATGDFIVCLDGDGTYPIEAIPSLVQLMEERRLDFLSCCRLPLNDPSAMSLRNQLGNRALTWLANRLFGLKLRDIMSGMWVMRRSALSQLMPSEGGVPVCIEVKLNAFLTPLVRAEHAHISYTRRPAGKSKLAPWRDGWRCLRLIWRWYRK